MDAIKDSPITEFRVGKLILSHEIMGTAPYPKLIAFMANFLVVRAEYMFVSRCIEYTAYSALFAVTDEGDVLTSYYVTENTDGLLSIRRGE